MFLCYDLYRHITAKSFPSDSHFHRCHVPCVVPGNEGKTLMTPGRLLPLPPTPLGESREKKIIQKPYAEWKSSSSGPNCQICVTWPHFRPWLLLMAQTFLFFKRRRFSFLPHFLPMKCKDQSNLQVSRQRGPGCSLYRLLCNYWCYFDLVMLVNGQHLFWAQEASGPLAVPLHYTNTCSLNISLAVTLQRKPRVKHH